MNKEQGKRRKENGKNNENIIHFIIYFIFDNDPLTIEQTIIDGSQSGCVVVFDSGESSISELNGFTLTNGQVNTTANLHGGGITCKDGSSPTLKHLYITNNSAPKGGGVRISDSDPIILHSIISNNIAIGDDYSHGGGMVVTKQIFHWM